MPGAREQTSQVTVLNATWAAGDDGEDGRFEVMLVTADGQFTDIGLLVALTGKGRE